MEKLEKTIFHDFFSVLQGGLTHNQKYNTCFKIIGNIIPKNIQFKREIYCITI